jgi:SAM-dependent methyltransferase
MRARSFVLGAGLLAVAAAAALRVAASRAGADAAPRPTPAAGSWATCSAPSARAYELAFGWLLGGLYGRMADDLALALEGIDDPGVLEIGPGPGHLAVELARRVPTLRLAGIDIDPAMVERATARAGHEGLAGRVRFEVGDVAALPFPDGSFDLVTSSFSVHHWPDAPAGFAEIRRVLRPGGRAIVYDLPDAWGRLETQAPALAAAAAAGGLEAARVDRLRWPGPVAFVRRLDAPAPG